LDIDVVAPSALTPAQIADWTRFQTADSALGSPFLSPGWALAVERAQAGGRGRAGVAVLSEAGRAKGFFPARVDGVTAMPLGAPLCDYQALVGAADLDLDPRRLVQALGVDRLDFSFMLGEQGPFGPFMRGAVPSYRIDVGQGYAAYEAERRAAGSGVLKDIDKRRRKIEREVGPVRFTADACCPAAFETLKTWKRDQFHATRQTDLFETPWARHLFESLLVGGDADFGGMLFTLHVGDRLAAAQFNLRGRRTLHSWIIAHEGELERYSPGLILFGEILRWMDATPFSVLDLGAGDYRFKLQLSNDRLAVAHGFVGRPSPASALRAAAYGVRAAAERLPLGRFSALPGKAMRRMDILRALR
jgi:CelD/BcsL family acetyltransferase involved in cellulose biosynthesis